MHLSPKILGLNAGIFEMFLGIPRQFVLFFFVLLLKNE